MDLAFPQMRKAQLIERENRFAVRALAGGEEIRLHLANSGRLRFLAPGTELRYLPRPGPRTAGRVVLAKDRGAWVLLDSGYAERALPRLLPRLGYEFLSFQPRFGPSRFDALVLKEGAPVPLEMKSATHVEGGFACFPDAKSARARKHLRGLLEAGGVLVFAALNPHARAFRPCPFDPEFGEELELALEKGLRVHAVRAEVAEGGLRWAEELSLYSKP